MDKYQNKYRIASARATFWNYGWPAAYFVTICTKDRKHLFGEVVDGQMVLSETGKIVKAEWLKTFDMRPDMNLQMSEYVVMPNHFHEVVIIWVMMPMRGMVRVMSEINLVHNPKIWLPSFGDSK